MSLLNRQPAPTPASAFDYWLEKASATQPSEPKVPDGKPPMLTPAEPVTKPGQDLQRLLLGLFRKK
jgi:hypothetical protein